MLNSLSDMLTWRAEVGDRTLPVSDFLLDTKTRHLTYIAVDLGGWLDHHYVLVAASMIGRVDTEGARLHLAITEDELRHAPRWEGEHSALADMLTALPPLVVGPFGATHAPLAIFSGLIDDAQEQTDSRAKEALARFQRVTDWIGSEVFASDGSVGELSDLLYDADKNEIVYLVIDNRHILTGKLLVVPLSVLRHRAPHEHGGHLVLDVPKSRVETAPQIDEIEKLARSWAPRLDKHFFAPI